MLIEKEYADESPMDTAIEIPEVEKKINISEDITTSDSKEEEVKLKSCDHCQTKFDSISQTCPSCRHYHPRAGETIDLSQTYFKLPMAVAGSTIFAPSRTEDKWAVPPPLVSHEDISTDDTMQEWILNHIPSEEAKEYIIMAGKIGVAKTLAVMKKDNQVKIREEKRKEEAEEQTNEKSLSKRVKTKTDLSTSISRRSKSFRKRRS